MRSVAIALVLSTLGAGSAQAMPAAATNNGSFRISTNIAPSCTLNYGDPITIVEGATRSVLEACNISGGFTVQAHYRPLNDAERVSLRYGNEVVTLSPTGSQTLGHSTRAAVRDMPMRFDDVRLDAPVALTLTIAPR